MVGFYAKQAGLRVPAGQVGQQQADVGSEHRSVPDRPGQPGRGQMMPLMQKFQGRAVAGPGPQPHNAAAQFLHPDRHGGGRGGLVLLAEEDFGGYQPGHGGFADQPAGPGDGSAERQRVDAPQGHACHGPPITSTDHWSPNGVALQRHRLMAAGSRAGHRRYPLFTYIPKVLRCNDMEYAMSRCARVPMMLGLLSGEAYVPIR